MDVVTVSVALLLGFALGALVVRALLWWRAYEVRSAETALQRRKVAFEARRVACARRKYQLEPARVSH